MRKSKSIVSSRQTARAKNKLMVLQGAMAVGAVASMNGPAYAAQNTATTLTLLASVTNQCFVAPATMSFGTFGVFSAGSTPGSLSGNTVTASANLPIACTNGVTGTVYAAANTITLSGSTTSNKISAFLFASSNYSTTFGVAASAGQSYVGNGSANGTVPLYGQIIPVASTNPDAYSGTVQLTVQF